VQAEGFLPPEMKHGTIALIDEQCRLWWSRQ